MIKKYLFALCITILIALLFLSTAFNLNYFIYPLKYYNVVALNAEEFNVDRALVFAIIKTESNFNCNAVSSVGAIGLMQLMPATATFIAEKIGEHKEEINLKNGTINIRLGVAYLSYLQNKFKHLDVVICAYNAGEGEVLSWLDSNGKLKIIKFNETKNYLNKVKTALTVYKQKLSNI